MHERWNQHVTQLAAGKHHNSPLLTDYKMFGLNSFEHSIHQAITWPSDWDFRSVKVALWAAEIMEIAAAKERGEDLYNLTAGGGSFPEIENYARCVGGDSIGEIEKWKKLRARAQSMTTDEVQRLLGALSPTPINQIPKPILIAAIPDISPSAPTFLRSPVDQQKMLVILDQMLALSKARDEESAQLLGGNRDALCPRPMSELQTSIRQSADYLVNQAKNGDEVAAKMHSLME